MTEIPRRGDLWKGSSMFTLFEPLASRRARHALSAGAALLLASGCGSDGPTGSECNELTSLEIVGLLDVLYAGQELQVSANTVPAGCEDGIVWSASPGITIDQSGTIEGDLVGGPFTITATAGGMMATGEVSVASGPPVSDTRWALAWVNQMATPSYTVANGYEYTTGGNITSTRTGTGAYTLRFSGLAATGGQRQNVQLSAYYSNAPTRCRTLATVNEGSDLVVSVRCHDLAGDPRDSLFDIVVVPAGSLQGRSAFVVSTSPQGGPVPAAMAHNSALMPIDVERTDTGVYRVTFGGLTRNYVGGGPDHVQITSHGEGTAWCKLSTWDSGAEDLVVVVRCFTPGGDPADAAFSALVVERGRTGKRTGFVWADDQTSGVLYTPDAGYNYNSSGTPNRARRYNPGNYDIEWTGLQRTGPDFNPETNLITAYGEDATYCQVSGWGSASTTFLCYAPNGTLADSRFSAMWIE